RHIEDAAEHDTAWPVRARAAELAKGLPGAQAALLDAARDPEPRVREAALGSLVEAPSEDAVHAAAGALANDGWSFVKVRAVGVLANAPASQGADDALGAALGDSAARVRGAALVALARRRATSWRSAIRQRLEDADEDADVRAAAASALGAVCDSQSLDRLTELARGLGAPASDEDAQQVGFGALVGLAAMKPPDLRDRLAPLLAASARPYVRAAAARALGARGMCR
ncbi:MAG: HEAT repeat domain-containing protein, partial [Polyangiaceae bacterium]